MRLFLIIAALSLGWFLCPAWWPLWLLGIAFSPGCTCCGPSCTIVSDSFGTDDISTNWTLDTAGIWSISGGTLNAGSTNARLINNAAHPAGGFMRVSATITGASGDVAILYGAYKNASNNVSATITFGASGSIVLKQNGTTLSTQSISLSGPVPFELCISQDGGKAVVQYNSFASNISSPISALASGSVYAGVGIGATASSVAFDDFSVIRTDNGCGNCLQLCSGCAGGFFAAEYELVATGVANGTNCSNCASFNGTFILNKFQGSGGQCIMLSANFTPCAPGQSAWVFYNEDPISFTNNYWIQASNLGNRHFISPWTTNPPECRVVNITSWTTSGSGTAFNCDFSGAMIVSFESL